MDDLISIAVAGRAASRKLALLSPAAKNAALAAIAGALLAHSADIVEANGRDMAAAQQAGMAEAMQDRLRLTAGRVEAMAHDVNAVASLPDPVGEVFDRTLRPNGLRIHKRRVPFGVIGVVYEARPNVTSDVAALCLKTGNAAILRGGHEALHSNTAIVAAITDALHAQGLPVEAVQLIGSTDREVVGRLLKLHGYIDVIIPRGGAGLIRFVAENSTIPVIETGAGVCHTYVDKAADPEMAASIVYNAKVRRPTICNALDTVLVQRDIAPRALPLIAQRLHGAGVELRCDPAALALLSPLGTPAGESDWGKEFLALIAAVKVVDSLDGALDHIARYGSGHSEAIVTEDAVAAQRFLNEVDAAAVYWNASTQYTDGGEFGLGAEIGISTQKLHARGPMALRELTTYKWVIEGTGQVRP
jgi:glutamate-5-semialdehyde dehydrogenase